MRLTGQICLLAAFVGSGYSALALWLGSQRQHDSLAKTGRVASGTTFVALSVAIVALLVGLLTKDFQFQYVAQYASRDLPWQFAISSLWVGQAGSLLMWTWFTAVLAMGFTIPKSLSNSSLRQLTLSCLMGYCFFLTTVMVFAADPLAECVSPPSDGAGLSPVLRHPSMLIHPPIVFLGYALWAVPCALVFSALVTGEVDGWVRPARRWALAAWCALGVGILLGANWAYRELGWGGYWTWDPVENGSLMPWLMGTAALHTIMAWHRSGTLKKSACALNMATFALCNFSTFLTRSGIFSSLHAFSKSPIGWLFLGLMLLVAVTGGVLILYRRADLTAQHVLQSFWSREAMIAMSACALVVLTAAILGGTLSTAISGLVLEHPITVGPAFYNQALLPTALVVLSTTAIAPLLRWSAAPQASQRRALMVSAGLASVAMAVAVACGARQRIAIGVIGLTALAVAAFAGALIIERIHTNSVRRISLWQQIRTRRQQYGGFVAHIGLFCLVLGVTASSLGSRRQEVIMSVGDTRTELGRQIRFVQLTQQEQSDKLRVAAELEVSRNSHQKSLLRPAQHYYYLANEWTTEVAIDSTWGSDYYTILDANEGEQRVRLTLIKTPLISLMWLGGLVMALGAVMAIWPLAAPRAAADTGPRELSRQHGDNLLSRRQAA